MATKDKVKRNAMYARTRTHKIENLDYSEDELICVCGWRGSAYDEAAYKLHRKEAPPTDKQFIGPYNGSKAYRALVRR